MTNQYDRKPGLAFRLTRKSPSSSSPSLFLLFFLKLTATELVCSAEILDRQP
jgi:hypothetical protein